MSLPFCGTLGYINRFVACGNVRRVTNNFVDLSYINSRRKRSVVFVHCLKVNNTMVILKIIVNIVFQDSYFRETYLTSLRSTFMNVIKNPVPVSHAHVNLVFFNHQTKQMKILFL